MTGELCGCTPEVRGTSNGSEGVFARGEDLSKRETVGFQPKLDFRTGIARAFKYYSAVSELFQVSAFCFCLR